MIKKQIKITNDTKKVDKFSKLTDSEMRKAENIEVEAETEEVMQTGQENKKIGDAVVVQVEKDNQEKKKKADEDNLNKLDIKKHGNYEYKEALAESLYGFLKLLEYPKGYEAHVVMTNGSSIQIKGKAFATKNGILVILLTPFGDVFHQGVLTSYDPVVDYNAMMTLAVMVENQLDRVKGQLLDKSLQRNNLGDKNKIIT